jgi:dTDP-4-dehydrorhamnose 3,5-epimerase
VDGDEGNLRFAMTIKDVTIISGKLVTNERGFLREITRHDEPGFFPIAQLYQTCTREGVTKAWYKHASQFDAIFVLSGTMKMALWDERDDSMTKGVVQEIMISGEAPAMMRIPPGVWHGFRSMSGDLLLLHLNSHAYDLAEPDEERLPSDSDRIPYRWSSSD